jgi:hypothetical protein
LQINRHCTSYDFYEEKPMAEITGKLLSDLRPNGTVRILFVATFGGGNEAPLWVKNLGRVERDFVRTFGQTLERAAALRAELERNKVFCAAMRLDEAVAAIFCRV